MIINRPMLSGTDVNHVENPHVSVVVVNYNGLPFLRDCLDSLQGAFGEFSFEVIVVDNASTDGSREYLRNRRDIRLIESEVNTGFAGGNNIGVSSSRGQFVLLLNNDTLCLSSLAPLLECMNDDRCGVAGCALFYADGKLQPSVGFDHTPSRVVMSWLGLGSLGVRIRAFCRVETDPGYYRHQHRSIDWISGACLLTRVDLWRRLGGFDDAFFMYCEDVDYCRRVRLTGFEVLYTPKARIRHYEGSGKAWIGGMALRRTARSYLIFMKKHYGSMSQFFFAVSLGLVFVLRSAIYRMGLLVFSGDAVRNEKNLAYLDVGTSLIRYSLGSSSLETMI